MCLWVLLMLHLFSDFSNTTRLWHQKYWGMAIDVRSKNHWHQPLSATCPDVSGWVGGAIIHFACNNTKSNSKLNKSIADRHWAIQVEKAWLRPSCWLFLQYFVHSLANTTVQGYELCATYMCTCAMWHTTIATHYDKTLLFSYQSWEKHHEYTDRTCTSSVGNSTNSHQHSRHPSHYKCGILYSRSLRIKSILSRSTNYHQRA